MDTVAHYLDTDHGPEALRALARELGVTEFAQVRNLDYVFSPAELYPLAPRVTPPLDRIVAFAVDMDGTSTTTEPLALHALEHMVRRITGRPDPAQWPGLDEHLDTPHVIGSSNFRHVEFLLQRYRPHINRETFAAAYIEALCWTLGCIPDEERRREVSRNARNCGLSDLLATTDLQTMTRSGPVNTGNLRRLSELFVSRFAPAFRPRHASEEVAAALDIYYTRYHTILQQLDTPIGKQLAAELVGDSARRLVEPMPGYTVFVALVKGWLGPEIDALYEPLREHLLGRPELGYTPAALDAGRARLATLAAHFRRQPARLALVTASIAHEMKACAAALVRAMAGEVQDWPVSNEVKERLATQLANYHAVYDAMACATDTWEARLKPHRDLYSLALFRMSVPKQDYRCVVGLEDTEPGIIALRAAGVGCAVALPNRDTQRQDYSAAIDVVHGGLPELILARNLLLPGR